MKIKTIFNNISDISLENYLKKCNISDVQEYINPSGKYIESPYIYKNMLKGVQLIKYHILQNDLICIICDNDADGVCSTTLTYKYLKLLEPKLNIKILIHKG